MRNFIRTTRFPTRVFEQLLISRQRSHIDSVSYSVVNTEWRWPFFTSLISDVRLSSTPLRFHCSFSTVSVGNADRWWPSSLLFIAKTLDISSTRVILRSRSPTSLSLPMSQVHRTCKKNCRWHLTPPFYWNGNCLFRYLFHDCNYHRAFYSRIDSIGLSIYTVFTWLFLTIRSLNILVSSMSFIFHDELSGQIACYTWPLLSKCFLPSASEASSDEAST